MFGYGCAVFMQSDIVDFQRQGWKPEEILAGPGQRAAEEYLAVRFADSQPGLAGHDLRAARRHAAQSGRGESAGGFHRIALPRQGRQAQRDRARTLRRIRRHRRGHRSQPAVEEWPPDQLYRPGRGGEDQLRHAPQRRHALLLLQEQVPAHLHRREADARRARRKSRLQDLQDSHRRGHQAPDRQQQLRRGLVEDVNAMREIKKGMDSVKDANPNMAEIAAKMVFKSFQPPQVSDPLPRYRADRGAKGSRRGHEAPRQRCASASRAS